MVKNELGESRREWLLHLFRYHAKFLTQNKYHMTWQKTNHPIELSETKILEQKIQHNPLKSGYVTRPEHWKYNSANLDSPLPVGVV